jgi:hypothetical protein
MRKALIALMAGGVLATAAAPVLAQDYPSTVQREDNLSMRIDNGARRGDLGPGQVVRLRGELREIVDLDARYQSEGMSDWQTRDIQSRLNLLSSRLSHEINMNRDYNGY